MKVKEILEQVQNQKISVEKAQQLLEQPLDYATIDFDREKRTGISEVIYGEGKTARQIAGIIQNMLDHDCKTILATRISQDKRAYLDPLFPDFEYDELARTFFYHHNNIPHNIGKIAVVCAGTSDLPVAREAYITAKFLGNETILISDVGVAGIHRLFNRLDDIREASVVVVVAGMEGALASVVGGLTDKPVIACPTSVGYGANLDGLATLLAMLNSCASGIAVVNIDNGFGAGYMAHSINTLKGKRT